MSNDPRRDLFVTTAQALVALMQRIGRNDQDLIDRMESALADEAKAEESKPNN